MGPKKESKKEEEPPKEPIIEVPPPVIQGYGRFEYLNGSVYEGQWKMVEGVRMKHGTGLLRVPGLSAVNTLGSENYEGGWIEDRMEGYGVYTYADGAQYSGEWKRGEHEGKGVYEFADGTRYEGDWVHHLMHGTGSYVDSQGRLWSGEFREGRFDSRRQNALIAEKAKQQQKQVVLEQIKVFLTVVGQALLRSDKKTIKDNLNPYLVQGDLLKEILKQPYARIEDRPIQKWVEVIQLLQKVDGKVLESASQGVVIGAERILIPQLQGIGQVVEIIFSVPQRSVKAAAVKVDGERWQLAVITDQERKK